MNRNILMSGLLMAVLLLFIGAFAPMLSVSAQDTTFQDPYAVNGVVTDKSGNPVAGAVVEVKNLRTEQVLTTTTNEHGEYIVSLNSMSSGYQSGDDVKVTATKGNTVGSQVGEVDSGDFHTVLDVTLGEEAEEDDRTFLEDYLWWIVGGVAVLVIAIVGIYLYTQRDEL